MNTPGTQTSNCFPINGCCLLQIMVHSGRSCIYRMQFGRASKRFWPRGCVWLVCFLLASGMVQKTPWAAAQSPVQQWSVDTSGFWDNTINWMYHGQLDWSHPTVKLGRVITSPRTVFLDGDINVHRIEFDNENSYALSSLWGASVVFDSKFNDAGIEVDQGSHQFLLPVELQRDLNLDLAFGSTLAFGKELYLNGQTLYKTRAGELQINGNLNISRDSTGHIAASRGTIAGLGTIGGDLSNISATVAPGPGFGQLYIAGHYSQDTNAFLEIELGSAIAGQYDVLNISQDASLGGILSLSTEGLETSPGDQFEILNFSYRHGNFAEIQGLTLSPNLRLVPQYGPNHLRLTVAELDYWTGESGDWNHANNWQSGFIPDTSTVSVIDNGGTANISITTPTIAGLDIRKGALRIHEFGSLSVNGMTKVASGNLLKVASTGNLDASSFQTQDMTVAGIFDLVNRSSATISNELSVDRTGVLNVSQDSTLSVQTSLKNFDRLTQTLTDGNYNIRGVFTFPHANIRNNRATLVLNGSNALLGDFIQGGNALNRLTDNTTDGSLTLINHLLQLEDSFTNAGVLTVQNSLLETPNSFFQTAGVTRLNGGTLASRSAEILAGQLTGWGTIVGPLTNAADLLPGLDGTGILEFQGGFSQLSMGRLEIEIGGQQAGEGYDQLRVTGEAAELGGLLELHLTNNFQPRENDLFFVVQGNVRSPFDALLFPNATDELAVDLQHRPNGVTVAFTKPTEEIYASPVAGNTWSNPETWLKDIPDSLDIVNLTKTTPGNQILTVDTNAFVHQAMLRSSTDLSGDLTMYIPPHQNWSATHHVHVGTNSNIRVDGGNFYAGGDVIIDGEKNAAFHLFEGRMMIEGDLKLGSPEGYGVYTLSGGTLDMGNGDILVKNSSSDFEFSGGRLTNLRRLFADNPEDANLVQVGGTLAPGNSPGTTEIEGDYTIMDAGTLEIEVEGTAEGEFDELLVGGNATLDGTLEIQVEGHYEPDVGDTIIVLTAASISGEFSSVTTPTDNDTIMVPIYSMTSMMLCGSTLGDMDLDCDVDNDDIDDFVLALNEPITYALQEGLSGEALGDFDADNDLDFDDVDGFAMALGGSLSVQQILQWVPEPGSFMMWNIAWLLWCVAPPTRRKKRQLSNA